MPSFRGKALRDPQYFLDVLVRKIPAQVALLLEAACSGDVSALLEVTSRVKLGNNDLKGVVRVKPFGSHQGPKVSAVLTVSTMENVKSILSQPLMFLKERSISSACPLIDKNAVLVPKEEYEGSSSAMKIFKKKRAKDLAKDFVEELFHEDEILKDGLLEMLHQEDYDQPSDETDMEAEGDENKLDPFQYSPIGGGGKRGASTPQDFLHESLHQVQRFLSQEVTNSGLCTRFQVTETAFIIVLNSSRLYQLVSAPAENSCFSGSKTILR